MSKFSWPEAPRLTAFPIARPGFSFIIASAFATLVFTLCGLKVPAVLGLLLTLYICYFFRDPDRVTPTEAGAVVSPADGKVVTAKIVDTNDFIEGPALKISVFMSVFNVHVNRIPYDGRVTDISYFPGKFFNASLDKASKDNERNAVIVEMADGRKYCTVQIAGLVARRIVCGLRKGDDVQRGRRFGMICFGSRLDIYLPADTEAGVSVGDKVKAGTSVLGYIK